MFRVSFVSVLLRPRTVVAIAIGGFLGLAAYAMAGAAGSPPTVVIYSYSHRYFSPDGDGQEDAGDLYYCLAESANVTVTVTGPTGQAVRTLEDAVSHPGSSSCSGSNNYAS